MRTEIIALLCLLSPAFALADNVVHPGRPVFDRPTLTSLGVQLPVTGDDNFNAAVTVRYRQTGASNWRQALPLFRVHPENTALWTVAPQFAGSVFDLRPNTSYDIELHLTDPRPPEKPKGAPTRTAAGALRVKLYQSTSAALARIRPSATSMPITISPGRDRPTISTTASFLLSPVFCAARLSWVTHPG